MTVCSFVCTTCIGSANTKRTSRGTMNSDRPSLPKSARPLPKFTSDKIVGSPLWVLTGSIAIMRDCRVADRDNPVATAVPPRQGTAQDQFALLGRKRPLMQSLIPHRVERPK